MSFVVEPAVLGRDGEDVIRLDPVLPDIRGIDRGIDLRNRLALIVCDRRLVHLPGDLRDVVEVIALVQLRLPIQLHGRVSLKIVQAHSGSVVQIVRARIRLR